MTDDRQVKKFPLRLEISFSKEIDSYVFYTESPSKHQYIIDAIKEKIARDKIKYPLASNE